MRRANDHLLQRPYSARDIGTRVKRVESATHRRSVAYSTLSVDKIERLFRHYDCGHPVQGSLFVRGVSDTYFLSTPEQQFALKIHRANWRSQEAVLQEVAAIRHAGAKGVDVAMPIARSDGEWITNIRAPEGPRMAVLFPWASGCAPKYADPNHALQFGRTVAELHIAGDDFQSYTDRPRMDMDYLFRRPLGHVRSQLKNFPALVTRLDRLAERIEDRLCRVEAYLPDWGFCHGDIYANNARIDGDHLVLFDFDFCGLGWRVFDLATYRWQARIHGAEKVAWKSFLDGYLQIRPAAAKSLPFVDLFMMVRHLWNKAHIIGLTANFGISMLTDEFLEDAVLFCESLESEARTR